MNDFELELRLQHIEQRLSQTEAVKADQGVADHRKICETVFGFLHYPEQVTDIHGAVLAEPEFRKAWAFRGFVESPDPRYRQIAGRFREPGFVRKEMDDYAPAQ